MKPINVSFVIDNLGRAGTETQLLALIRSLDRAHVNPSLVVLNGDKGVSQSLEPSGCDVTRLGVTKLFSSHAAKAAYRLRKKWIQATPDVVVAYFLDSAYFALPIAKWCGAKTVRVRNNLGYWLSAKHRWFGRAVRPFVDAVLTNSEDGKSALVKEGESANYVSVIENGVDLDRFFPVRPVDVSKPIVRIGCVANLRPVKNIDGLIRVATLLCSGYPNIRFEVAGEGEQRDEYEKLIDSMSLQDRFVLRGSIADIPGFLSSCEIAVLPSHSEGMSNALLEYMAAGRAVITTDVGANRMVLGDTGVIVPANDDKALSLAIESLINRPDEAKRFGQLARLRIETNYSRVRMIERFTTFFHHLTSRVNCRAA